MRRWAKSRHRILPLKNRKTASWRPFTLCSMLFVQALAARFFRFLRQPSRPNAPGPPAKRGKCSWERRCGGWRESSGDVDPVINRLRRGHLIPVGAHNQIERYQQTEETERRDLEEFRILSQAILLYARSCLVMMEPGFFSLEQLQSELVIAFDQGSKIRKTNHYVEHDNETDYCDEHEIDHPTEFIETVVLHPCERLSLRRQGGRHQGSLSHCPLKFNVHAACRQCVMRLEDASVRWRVRVT
jgi:hypothetical protein